MVNKLFRYIKVQYGESADDVRIELREFDIVSETPQGYWFKSRVNITKKQWTSKTATRRYAYPTKDLALNNFIRRTKKSIAIMKFNIDRAEVALRQAKELAECE